MLDLSVLSYSSLISCECHGKFLHIPSVITAQHHWCLSIRALCHTLQSHSSWCHIEMEFTSIRRHNHIPQYVSSLVTGWNPRVFYCFEEKKHHLPRDTDFICQTVFVFSLIDISFWSRSGYSNHGFRMRKRWRYWFATKPARAVCQSYLLSGKPATDVSSERSRHLRSTC